MKTHEKAFWFIVYFLEGAFGGLFKGTSYTPEPTSDIEFDSREGIKAEFGLDPTR